MKKILSVLCALAFIASVACLGVAADAPAVSIAIEAAPVLEGDTTLSANLMVTLPDGATGFELGSYGLDMSYDASVMKLADTLGWEVNGTTMESEKIEDNPYMILWVSVNPKQQYKAGTTLAATMTFDLAAPAVAGTEYKIDLAINAENGIATMASSDGKYTETKYTAEQVSITGATVVATVPTVATTTPAATEPVPTEPVTTEAPATEATTTEEPVVSSEVTSAPAESSDVTTEATTTTTATTKAPDKATQTGDMMFVVVAVMVVALGAAVVVKKVSVR